MSEPKKVFLSYAQSDSEFASELADQLAKLGVQPWLDKNELKPGDSWAEQIKAALGSSDAVVVVAGGGKPSANVLVEAGAALSQGIKLIPILIDADAEVGSIFSDRPQVQAVRESKVEQAAKEIAEIVGERQSDGH
ncbi:MAG: toll/interleukin-1 receptor domain-containing protein [Hyphomicrobiales bacterium]|nr:toll/interleukin-1 receptor domain-containing protein [Hyphomicrobiales bacterium]